jgi:hypothetical protein
MREISTTATTTVQADTGASRSLLSACQTVEQTELGAFFVNELGFVEFLSRADIVTLSGGTPTLFSDQIGSGDITYQAVQFDISDEQMINQVAVTRSGGITQVASDAASINDYFKHSRVRSGIMETDLDAENQALTIISSRKEQGVNIQLNSLKVDAFGTDDPSRTVAALNLDVFDPIQVTQTFPNGNVVSDTLIGGVEYQITPRSFMVTFSCAQPFAVGFLLDSSVDGILDQDFITY